MPHASPTARPISPWVLFPSSTAWNSGIRTVFSAGTTSGTVLYASPTEERLSRSLPKLNVDEGGGEKEKGIVTWSVGGMEAVVAVRRYREVRCRSWERSVVWMVLTRRSELIVSTARIRSTGGCSVS